MVGAREASVKPETPPARRHGRRWGQSRFGVMNACTADALAPTPSLLSSSSSPYRRRRCFNSRFRHRRRITGKRPCGLPYGRCRPRRWPRPAVVWTCRTPFSRAWWPSARPSATGWWSWPFNGNDDSAGAPTITSYRWRSPTCWSVWWAYRAPCCPASVCPVTCTCACSRCRW